MKYTTILASLILSINLSFSQSTESRFKLKSSIAFGGTDERIFGLNERLTSEITKGNQEKLLPSMYFDTGIEYNFLDIGNFNFYGEVNYAFEWNNSHRTYNHCIIVGTPCPYVLYWVDGYSYHMLGTSFSIDYTIYSNSDSRIKIGATISPRFRFLTFYDSQYKYLWKIDYLFTEIEPYISINLSQYEIGLFTRVWQHRKVDRGIYPTGSGSGHPVLADDYMNINPWKIGIFIKYDFPFRKSNSKLDERE